jgi:hypothetical protein
VLEDTYTTTFASASSVPATTSSVVGGCEYNFAQLGSLDMLMILGFAGWPLRVTFPLSPLAPGAADTIGKQSRAAKAVRSVFFEGI